MYNFFLFIFFPSKFFKTKRGSRLLNEWSREVRKRDIKCVKCGSSNSLEAHHIYPKSIYPRRFVRLSNGITLCKTCHRVGDSCIHHVIPKKEMNLRTTRKFLKNK